MFFREQKGTSKSKRVGGKNTQDTEGLQGLQHGKGQGSPNTTCPPHLWPVGPRITPGREIPLLTPNPPEPAVLRVVSRREERVPMSPS